MFKTLTNLFFLSVLIFACKPSGAGAPMTPTSEKKEEQSKKSELEESDSKSSTSTSSIINKPMVESCSDFDHEIKPVNAESMVVAKLEGKYSWYEANLKAQGKLKNLAYEAPEPIDDQYSDLCQKELGPEFALATVRQLAKIREKNLLNINSEIERSCMLRAWSPEWKEWENENAESSFGSAKCYYDVGLFFDMDPKGCGRNCMGCGDEAEIGGVIKDNTKAGVICVKK